MDYAYSDLIEKAKSWSQQGVETGWLSQSHADALNQLDERTPASLFDQDSQRPLVVAFFGGTGVGKSTLLNRLANQQIARTGVERPTSREVTVYHHQSIQLGQLPSEFPLDTIKTANHNDEQFKEIMWVDMPDIDSVEEDNRKLVLSWLPHIDVLIYVVNPERYRDNSAWRILLAEGQSHAWIFVMNQWDRGEEAQVGDFTKQLQTGGFKEPMIFRTDCRTEKPVEALDEFSQLRETVLSLANNHIIEQLELRGVTIRLKGLQQNIDRCLEALSIEQSKNTLSAHWKAIWADSHKNLLNGMEWPIQEISKLYVKRDASLIRKRLRLDDTPPTDQDGDVKKKPMLWDHWAQTRLVDAINQFAVEVDANQVPARPFKAALEKVQNQATQLVNADAEEGLRSSLLKPGNFLQRFLFKFTGICTALLPLAAISWVGYQVFIGYHESNTSDIAYLGTEFAIHSGILIAISWLLPWFLHRQLKPSAEKAALRGLRVGVEEGLDTIGDEVSNVINETLTSRATFFDEGKLLIEQCESPVLPKETSGEEILSRILAR